MDSMTLIAIVSIVMAGLTTGFGTMGPALAEGKAVASALTSLAQQPDASATITRTLFVGLAMIESTAIYCFVVSMILIFANPFWNHVISSASRKLVMLIDWFTVGAQALNFLILVWLMKRFLYKPILNAIDAREDRIAAELADADATRDAANKERDKFQHKNEEFDTQQALRLSQATEEVATERERLLGEARAAADDLSSKRQEALKREQENLAEEMTSRTQQEVFAIARKTLTDLAGASLEERMSDVFACRVRELNGEAKDDLAHALSSSSTPAFVRSTFDLPADQRNTIQQALNETFAADIKLSFETKPTVISGIELSANGHKVGWSIDEYLTSLERSVGELMHKPTQSKMELADISESENE